MSEEIKRLALWRAMSEMNGDTYIVLASDFDKLAAELAELKAKRDLPPPAAQANAELMRDAERYHYLRAHGRQPIAVRDHVSHLYFEKLDAAIDAAIAKARGDL